MRHHSPQMRVPQASIKPPREHLLPKHHLEFCNDLACARLVTARSDQFTSRIEANRRVWQAAFKYRLPRPLGTIDGRECVRNRISDYNLAEM